ncbi:MAG: hypothetical protein ACQESF_07140 [Nanobdellota archaeon]
MAYKKMYKESQMDKSRGAYKENYVKESYQKDTFLTKDYEDAFKSQLESLLPHAPY